MSHSEMPPVVSRYINRELSWIRFNRRVLDEATDLSNPLLERIRFLSIFSNNLDEFFMIRVSGLIRQLKGGVFDPQPETMSPSGQLVAIRKAIALDIKRQITCWKKELVPELSCQGIHILSYNELNEKGKKHFDAYFQDAIFPVLTPLAFDIGHPFPHISNLSLNLALVLEDPIKGEVFARLKIPEIFPRLLTAPDEGGYKKKTAGLTREGKPVHLIFIENLIRANLKFLFPGLKVLDAILFRVTRDADIEIEEDEAEDLLDSVKEGIDRRRFGDVVRLQVEKGCSKRIRDILTLNLGLAPFQVYSTENPIGKSTLMQIASIPRPDLSYPSFSGGIIPELEDEGQLFNAIKKKDILLYHPYDSYRPVVDFITEASRDPNVLAIKQTLYRTGKNSPIVRALKRACQAGKQVAVLVELKARFDEENNIGWARELESAGVHVVYGVMGLKTHAKVCMVVRQELKGICRYIHLGTGNYNPATARIYTDFGLFTCNSDIAADVAELFNFLTGYSKQTRYRKLLVAPGSLRQEILARIKREAEQHRETGNGRIVFKLNSLSDKECIDALYAASKTGVRIDLQVRGICCLRPQVPGLSDNIHVTSIVGRFLEHPRVFYFNNNGMEELFLGSADLMMRNLDKRVEILFPIEDPFIKNAIIYHILPVHLSDTVNATYLTPEGEYLRVPPEEGEKPVDSQKWMLEHYSVWHRANEETTV